MIPKARSILALAVTIPGSWATAVSASHGVIATRNVKGVNAVIYTASYIAERTTPTSATRGYAELEDGTRFWFITDIADAAIHNKGDGAFHPYDADLVMTTLQEMECPDETLEVEVFILPFPRSDLLVSSASGNRIFLSPQVVEVQRTTAAYVIAHEMGHVFEYVHVPDLNGDGGDDYRRVRGISDETRFNAGAPHADRPSEIFAEDFRVLFGGPTAYFNGSIENSSLTPPEEVAGLEAFFRELPAGPDTSEEVEVGNYPNPFNPSTEVRVTLTDAMVARSAPVSIRVYDVRGRLIRELYNGPADATDLRVRWDGRDSRGANVASAMYFGVVEAGGVKKTQKLLLIK